MKINNGYTNQWDAFAMGASYADREQYASKLLKDLDVISSLEENQKLRYLSDGSLEVDTNWFVRACRWIWNACFSNSDNITNLQSLQNGVIAFKENVGALDPQLCEKVVNSAQRAILGLEKLKATYTGQKDKLSIVIDLQDAIREASIKAQEKTSMKHEKSEEEYYMSADYKGVDDLSESIRFRPWEIVDTSHLASCIAAISGETLEQDPDFIACLQGDIAWMHRKGISKDDLVQQVLSWEIKDFNPNNYRCLSVQTFNVLIEKMKEAGLASSADYLFEKNFKNQVDFDSLFASTQSDVIANAAVKAFLAVGIVSSSQYLPGLNAMLMNYAKTYGVSALKDLLSVLFNRDQSVDELSFISPVRISAWRKDDSFDVFNRLHAAPSSAQKASIEEILSEVEKPA